MFTIYVYVLETLADWELSYVTSELHSGRFFKKDAECVSLKTVSYSKEPIHTMGGLTVIPDCLIDDVVVSETSGDLPPLFKSTGFALSLFLPNRFSINEVIEKTVIIHDHADNFTTQPSGNSDTEIACGVMWRTAGLGV